MGIIKTRGSGRLLWLQIHRLEEFERAFGLYLDGKVPASRVTERWQKLAEVGLPGGKPRKVRK